MSAAPQRTVGITLTPFPMGRYREVTLAIVIDGVSQPAKWGRGQWSLPADRPVTIAAMMFSIWGKKRRYGFVEYVLPPGSDIELEYKAPAYFSAPGAMGPVGAVRTEGTGSYARFVGITVAIAAVVAVGLSLGLLLFL